MALISRIFDCFSLKTIRFVVCLTLAQLTLNSFVERASAETLDILMILWRGETEAESGFRDKLRARGVDARITVFNAGQDRGMLATALRTGELKLDQYDYVYTFGTTVSQMVKFSINNTVPQIFCVSFNPVKSRLVNSFEGSGSNITGVSSGIPMGQSVEIASSIFPVNHLAILFNPREQNSSLQVEEIMLLGKTMGIRVTPVRVGPTDAFLAQVLNHLKVNKALYDTVFIPGDSYLKSQAAKIMAVLRKTDLKIIANNINYLREGALFGLVTDFYTIGQICGDTLLRVQAGENIAEMPIGFIRTPKIIMNQDAVKRLNILIPAARKQNVHFITSDTDSNS